jgi:hypothetical protein
MIISISNSAKVLRQIMPPRSAGAWQQGDAAMSFFFIFSHFSFFKKSHIYTNLLKVFGLRLNKLDLH